MNIQEAFLSTNKYSRPQTPLKSVTKIAIHYVGNAGSSARGNRNYFENLKTGKKTSSGSYIFASSHFVVDDKEILQCLPLSEISYCTNSANSYSISIETCHPDNTGKFSDATYSNLIELCAFLCDKYKLNPLTDLIRHYDVTQKMCPIYYVKNPKAWEQLKQDVDAYLKKGTENTHTPYMLKIDYNGVEREVSAILQGDNNYIKLRDLASAGFVVGYDKVPTVTTKNGVQAHLGANDGNMEILYNGNLLKVNSILHEEYNYVRLRDLDSCDFQVGYKDGKVCIYCSM